MTTPEHTLVGIHFAFASGLHRLDLQSRQIRQSLSLKQLSKLLTDADLFEHALHRGGSIWRASKIGL
jgi:hypothetical protein